MYHKWRIVSKRRSNTNITLKKMELVDNFLQSKSKRLTSFQ